MKRILSIIRSEKKWLEAVFSLSVGFDFRHCARVRSPEGWRGSDDLLDSHLLFFVEKGVIEGVVDGREISANAGTVIWCQPGARRIFQVKKGCRSTRNIRVRFNLLKGNKKIALSSYMIKHNAWELYPYLQAMHRTARKQGACSGIEMRALLAAFFAAFFDLKKSGEALFRTFSEHERRTIERLVNEKLFEGLLPLDMALASGYCLDYFTRVFKQTYGIPPRTYLLHEKMRSAAELLTDTNLKLKEICLEIGEDDLSKFCRQFQSLYKCTPTQYRKKII